MPLLHRVAAGIRALVWKTRAERDLDAELRSYLNATIEQKISAGLTREAATRAARAEMGSVAAIKDDVRDAGGESAIEGIWRDVRHSARALRRSPGFTAVTIATLALGIGGTTAVFSVMNGVLIKPLPYQDPDALVGIWHIAPGANVGGDVKHVGNPVLHLPRAHASVSGDRDLVDGTGNCDRLRRTGGSAAVDRGFSSCASQFRRHKYPMVNTCSGFSARSTTGFAPSAACRRHPSRAPRR